MKKVLWSSEEDDILREYVKEHGEGKWHLIEKNSVLSRSWKSCRLRWLNHLRPDLKKGPITTEEEQLLIKLHAQMGNKWAQIAKHFPGRTDNELKNFWNKRMRRYRRIELPIYPLNDGSFRASDQNHHQQINGLPPYEDVFDPNFSNSIVAYEEQTGRSSKRQKCNRNSICPDVVVQNYEASDRVDLGSEWGNIKDDFFNIFEFLYENPAAITEHNEILENSVVEEEHVPVQLDVSMLDEQAIHLEQYFCDFECKPKNPAVIIKNIKILDNSVAGLKDEHVLSQQDFSMHYEQLEETQLKEDGLVANLNPMSEDEIAFLKPHFCNEHKMTLSEAINCEHPLAQYDRQFESESGDNAKEATAVDFEPLPIATMEESLEQSWSNYSWNETFSEFNLAMDRELPLIQNSDFDDLLDDIFSHDV